MEGEGKAILPTDQGGGGFPSNYKILVPLPSLHD